MCHHRHLKFAVFSWLGLTLLCMASQVGYAEVPVQFKDPQLKTLVEESLGYFDPTPTDMLDLLDLESIRPETLPGGITDLTGLEHAVNLQRLWLREHEFSDISALAGMKQLTTLHLSNNNIADVSSLETLIHLTHLDLHGNHQISDLKPLTNLTHLKKLILRYNRISDIEPLQNMTSLTKLNLQANAITDISPLSAMSQLQILYLGYNDITDLSPLRSLNQLQYLYLDRNRSRDLTPLAGLTELRKLGLYWNGINDISPLIGLRNLVDLGLIGNGLSDAAYCSDLHTLFSNNSGITLSYNYHKVPTTHVSSSAGIWPDRIHIQWEPVCNGPLYTSHYQVWRAHEDDPEISRVCISPYLTEPEYMDFEVRSGVSYRYWIATCSSNLDDNLSVFSEPSIGWVSSEPALRLSAGPGGRVHEPQPGVHTYAMPTTVPIVAAPKDTRAFIFSHWAGSAVTRGKVSNPTSASTTVFVDGNYTLTACFLSRFESIYIDPNARLDPGPMDSALSDPNEQGSPEHPFDSIQEAIDVAPAHATLYIAQGVYPENLVMNDKPIRLTGQDPGDPHRLMFPVVSGDGQAPLVQCVDTHDQATLEGIVLIPGDSQQDVILEGKSARMVLQNCLLAGFQRPEFHRAVIACEDSQIRLENCTLTDNVLGTQGACMQLTDSTVHIHNSIFWNNQPDALKVLGMSEIQITYSLIPPSWEGLDTLHGDPKFASPGQWLPLPDGQKTWRIGDYHLLSTAGRWLPHEDTWQVDGISSPCIDRGDPGSALRGEIEPHGDRINLGVYGGTCEASLSEN